MYFGIFPARFECIFEASTPLLFGEGNVALHNQESSSVGEPDGSKLHSKRVEKMSKLHSKRVEKMSKLHSERVERMFNLHSKRVEKMGTYTRNEWRTRAVQ